MDKGWVNTNYPQENPPNARYAFVKDLNKVTENHWTTLFDIENETEACAKGFIENHSKPDIRNFFVMNTGPDHPIMAKLRKNDLTGGMIVGEAAKSVQRYLFLEVAKSGTLLVICNSNIRIKNL